MSRAVENTSKIAYIYKSGSVLIEFIESNVYDLLAVRVRFASNAFEEVLEVYTAVDVFVVILN
jgi:hypothetical protein